MPFTDEQRQKIAEALSAKRGTAGPLVCPVCGTKEWNVVDDMVRLTLQPNPRGVTPTGSSLPLIALICLNCGNTQVLNVFILGVGDILGIKSGIPATPEGGGKDNG